LAKKRDVCSGLPPARARCGTKMVKKSLFRLKAYRHEIARSNKIGKNAIFVSRCLRRGSQRETKIAEFGTNDRKNAKKAYFCSNVFHLHARKLEQTSRFSAFAR
jgi:hypothetical protein